MQVHYVRANEMVVVHVSMECLAGKTRTGGHDATGINTACEATACGAIEKVIVLVCVECPARKISSGSHDVPGSNTASSPLRARQMQRLHVCMECLARKTSTGSQDATGCNTACEATACSANEKVIVLG